METKNEGSSPMGNILVVTSDDKLLRIVHSLLGKRGYHLSSTRYFEDHVKAALLVVAPKLVIIDLMMPEMTGLKVLLRIRGWLDVPTIMLSAWNTGENTLRRLDVRFAGYLSEPLGAALVEWVDGIMAKTDVACDVGSEVGCQ